jgi:arylformamidase
MLEERAMTEKSEASGKSRDSWSETTLSEIISGRNVHDISVILGEESIDYQGDTQYSRDLIATIKDAGIFDLSKLTLSSHSGTHIDAPAHFIQDGRTIDQFPVETFIIPALVLEIKDKEAIRSDELEGLEIKAGEALLLKTENSRQGISRSGLFSKEFVYLSIDAAEFCVGKQVGLIGIDYITVEQYGQDAFPVHRKLLGNNILILEGIDLSEVDAGRYTLICLPLKIKNCEASSVRAILVA